MADVAVEAGRGGKTIGQIVKLLELAQEKHQQMGELLAEARSLLAGDPGIGTLLKAVERGFDAIWCERYAPGQTGRYVWTFQKDRAQIKRLLKTLNVEQIIDRAHRYIRDDDDFYVRARHSFALFVSGINRFAPAAATPAFELSEDRRPYGCVHQPACRTDAEHTARRNRELRDLE